MSLVKVAYAAVTSMWLGCGPATPTEVDATAPVEAKPPAPSPAAPPDDVPVRPAAKAVAPEPEQAAPAVDFDPATVRAAVVRVVEIHDPGGATCGVIHSVGAFEVEVLNVGEPAPRLGLYVSCPADVRPRDSLNVGNTIRVTLHARKQYWPLPATRLPEGLPVRYARSIKDPG